MASTPGFEPGPHWWEKIALTAAPSLALVAKLNNVQTRTVFIDFLSQQAMDERNCFLDFCSLHLQCLT